YFHSLAARSDPSRVRAPQETIPNTGRLRIAFRASGLSVPFSGSESLYVTDVGPRRTASVPAGAFQTPRVPSVRAYRPAIIPLGGKGRARYWRSGSGRLTHGKYAAALELFGVATSLIQACASIRVSTELGTSTIRNARRCSQ